MDEDARLAELSKRWDEVNRLLDDLAAGRALPENEDPTVREQELLGELDRIEYDVGMIQRDRARREAEGEGA